MAINGPSSQGLDPFAGIKPAVAVIIMGILAGILWENYPAIGVPATILIVLMIGLAKGK